MYWQPLIIVIALYYMVVFIHTLHTYIHKHTHKHTFLNNKMCDPPRTKWFELLNRVQDEKIRTLFSFPSHVHTRTYPVVFLIIPLQMWWFSGLLPWCIGCLSSDFLCSFKNSVNKLRIDNEDFLLFSSFLHENCNAYVD